MAFPFMDHWNGKILNLLMRHGWQPRLPWADPLSWVPRKRNAEADALANLAIDTLKSRFFVHEDIRSKKSQVAKMAIAAWFDGGWRTRTISSCGFIIKCVPSNDKPFPIVAGSITLRANSSLEAELEGAIILSIALNSLADNNNWPSEELSSRYGNYLMCYHRDFWAYTPKF